MRTFDFTGVSLLSGSRWKSQQDEVTDYYLAIPTDSYLWGFRARAGDADPPGEPLAGWYHPDDLFHPFGQYVSGLARLYAANGRPEVRAKVQQLVTGFADTIEPDGYFFQNKPTRTAHYTFDKTLCGMLDAWLYCGIDRAQEVMSRITNWAIDNLTRNRDYLNSWESEWFTLSENLYRAYLATSDSRYSDFGAVWEFRGFWDRFHDQDDYFQTPEGEPVAEYHAYSHVNTLSGLGAGYLVFGDPYYEQALRNAYDMLRAQQCWATGGYGPFEKLLPDRAQLAATLQPFHHHFETQCGSWAVLKVSKYLLQITGEGRYGDWAEQMLYNGVGATTEMSGDGRVQYYTHYSPRGGRKVNVAPYSCCTGTRPQAVADYTDLVFLRGDDRLLVNLFLPARAQWRFPAGPLAARVETDFPASDRVALVIEQAPASSFALGFRAPGWLTGRPRTAVNGAPIRSTVERGWIVVTRTWRPGDRLEVRLPMDLRLAPFLSGEAFPTAVNYGPVTVAYTAAQNPAKDLPPVQLLARMRRASGAELAWTVAGRTDITARPFYAYSTGEQYFLYLDPDAGLYLAFEGEWGSLPFIAVTGAAGSTVTCDFEGPSLRWRWLTFPDAGIARVEIDGRFVQEVDQHTPDPEDPDEVVNPERSTEFTGLGEGPHRIRIVCTGTKHPASGSANINILDLDYQAAG